MHHGTTDDQHRCSMAQPFCWLLPLPRCGTVPQRTPVEHLTLLSKSRQSSDSIEIGMETFGASLNVQEICCSHTLYA